MTLQPSPFPKLIYFAERPAGQDATGFRERWREHARLGMSQPRWRNIERYVHCDPVDDAALDAFDPGAARLPKGGCDGIAMVWYRSERHRLDHVSDRSAAPLMKRDEAETFARPVREVSALTEEIVLRPCQPARFKLFLRLWRGEGVSAPAFRQSWSGPLADRLTARLEDSPGFRGYVQNHARTGDGLASVPPPQCDCIDEIATDSAMATETCVRMALDAAGPLVGRAAATWTTETLLHGQ